MALRLATVRKTKVWEEPVEGVSLSTEAVVQRRDPIAGTPSQLLVMTWPAVDLSPFARCTPVKKMLGNMQSLYLVH